MVDDGTGKRSKDILNLDTLKNETTAFRKYRHLTYEHDLVAAVQNRSVLVPFGRNGLCSDNRLIVHMC